MLQARVWMKGCAVAARAAMGNSCMNRAVMVGPQRTFATKLKASTTDSVRSPPGKRLGAKKIGGEEVYPGDIIMKQRGTKYRAGENVHMGRDHTLHASKEGRVVYVKDPWAPKKKFIVHVVQQEFPNRELPNPPLFMYHPELYPELAKNNPEPQNLYIPKFNKKKKQKFPAKLGVRKAEEDEVSKNFTSINVDTKEVSVLGATLILYFQN